MDNPKLGATELQKRLKEEYKVIIHYRRVHAGNKDLAMKQLYVDWDNNFNNLCKFKELIELSCLGSFAVIDHHIVEDKIRFNRLFFVMRLCIYGFLQGCRPYIALDSTFLVESSRVNRVVHVQ